MENFDVDKFKKHLKTDYIGKEIIYFKKIGSTNDYASNLIKKSFNKKYNDNNGIKIELKPEVEKQKDPSNGIIILAETQDKGRGRLEREWVSPAGGLWFTLILRTNIEEKDLPKVTLLIAYSIVETLRSNYDIKAIIKWPNDIYYKKLKLGGILTEIEKIKDSIYLIIGTGLNVNLNLLDLGPLNKKTTSIKSILGRKIERETLLSKILVNFEKNYEYYSQTNDFKTIFKKIEEILTYV